MANVHRIGDYQNNQNNQNMMLGGGMGGAAARRAPLLGQPQQPGAMPFFTTVAREGDPRKETPFDLCKSCCPSATWKSFTALITIVDIVLFIVTLCVHGLAPPFEDPVDFLPPNPYTLQQFGDRDPYLIRYEGQVWRFLTPVFLHANFLHIFFNASAQMILGSQVESILGTLKFIFLYFICAIGGNLFGALVSSALAVGASTAIVGMLGLFIAFVIVNWKRLDPNLKCIIVCIIIFIILMNLLFSVGGLDSSSPSGGSGSQVDNFGHLGGLITGTLVGMFIINPLGGPPQKYEKGVKYVGIGLTCFYFILGFSLFFTVVYPGFQSL